MNADGRHLASGGGGESGRSGHALRSSESLDRAWSPGARLRRFLPLARLVVDESTPDAAPAPRDADRRAGTVDRRSDGARDRRVPSGPNRGMRWGAATGASILLLWTVVMLLAPGVRFALIAPRATVSIAATASLAKLFGALVLFLFPPSRGRMRLYWVAAGLVVLGCGEFAYGYVRVLLAPSDHLFMMTYSSLVVGSTGAALITIGIWPKRAPNFRLRWLLIALIALNVAALALHAVGGQLPSLYHGGESATTLLQVRAVEHLTIWYGMLALIPLSLAIAAALGALRQCDSGNVGVWLIIAMILLAGAQLDNTFWPSAFSPILTFGDMLNLAFASVAAVGGLLELRRITHHRTTRLVAEEEHAKRMAELGVMKANFTAMVAHELSGPLAAIRVSADMMATGELGQVEQIQTLDVIRSEADMLASLVADVQTSASAERDDFTVHPRPVRLNELLGSAVAHARTLAGEHPLTSPVVTHEVVWADPDRIGQVIRNLLGNAAKYSPAGSPIELRARREGRRVRIEVADQGYGIHPDDLVHIFDKFGRGRDESGRRIKGIGLGLYLSRRIVQAHGSDLMVESAPGCGSVFSFELEVVL